MPFKIRKRINVSAIIVIIYVLTVFAVSVLPLQSWRAAATGLLAASIGSLVIFTLLRQWEAHFIKIIPVNLPELKPVAIQNPFYSNDNFLELEHALAESQARHKELIEELNAKNELMHKFETEKVQFEHRIEDVYHELNTFKSANEDELRRKTVLLSEYQETINQQRDVIKKKQDQILELESKVRDLNYEVKTLLQLAEIGNKTPTNSKNKEMVVGETVQAYQVDMFEDEEPSFQMQNLMIKTPEEASVQLKRCIDIAQKITGANRFGNGNSRFKDVPIDNRALDLRRLFDNLRSEHAGTVIVYSQKDDKLLFANNQMTNLLGWSPEKFIKNFPEIIAEGSQEWKKGVAELSSNTLSKVRMVMKTKSGQNLLVHCHLGAIPTGAFRNHVIGVLYSS
jgi:hypothetical protein